MENNQQKIAILIDAENISYKNASQIIDTMEQKGKVLVKMIVADWTKISGAQVKSNGKYTYRTKQIEGWREEASKHSMSAVQQFSYVVGKNSSDIALTIQAMKIFYEKPFITTFCLVSNDSDFTRLAQELREHNKEVVGMGERGKSIQEFVNAFSEFIYLGESIEDEPIAEIDEKAQDKNIKQKDTKSQETETQKSKKENRTKKQSPKVKEKNPPCFLGEDKLKALKNIIETDIEASDESVAYYSNIANRMKKLFADFIPENYDCKNISKLMSKLLPYLPEYQEHKEPIPNNPRGFLYMLKRR